MKKTVTVFLAALMMLSLSACSQAKGEAHSHSWQEATCTEPKTCAACGLTEGEALGHSWTPKTPEQPQTCSVCGLTEGEPLELYVIEPTHRNGSNTEWAYKNRSCTAEFGRNPRVLSLAYYDLSGNRIKEEALDLAAYDWVQYTTFLCEDLALFVCCQNRDGSFRFCAYDWDGSMICDTAVPGVKGTKYYNAACTDVWNVLELKSDKVQTDVRFLDLLTGELLEEYGREYREKQPDSNVWPYCERCEAVGGFLVGTADGSRWGYLDADGNELAMYADASNFSSGGYALVSDDRGTYDLIDSRFHIIRENCVNGTGASLFDRGMDLFTVSQPDGTRLLVSERGEVVLRGYTEYTSVTANGYFLAKRDDAHFDLLDRALNLIAEDIYPYAAADGSATRAFRISSSSDAWADCGDTFDEMLVIELGKNGPRVHIYAK